MKTTKRSLALSALSLLMCVAMLLGTTYAWFTDSVKSGKNIITAGNLDVEMYYADGTKAVPTTVGTDGWIDAKDAQIFNYKLWEPGYTAVYHIKIANVGTLALQYLLTLKPDTEPIGKLAEVLDVYTVYPTEGTTDLQHMATPISTRSDMSKMTKIGTLKEIFATQGSLDLGGKLLAGEDNTLTIAVKMQEEAGDEYKNTAVGDFTVVLNATQYTSESDSFDIFYDKEAQLTKNEDGTYTGEDDKVFVKDTEGFVEVEAVEGEAGLYIPADAPEESKFEKQYAGTNEAISSAMKNIKETEVDPQAAENVPFEVSLINNDYEDLSLTFKCENKKDVTLTAPKRTAITKSGNGVPAITVNSDSSYHDGEIVIENIDFLLSDGAVGVTFGNLGGSGATRYANNVTVQNCTLVSPEDDANWSKNKLVYSPSGSGTDNVSIKGCKVTHSGYLFEGYMTTLYVDECNVDAVHGINNQTSGGTLVVTNSQFNCHGNYCIRTNVGNVTLNEVSLATDSTETADAAIVFRNENKVSTDTAKLAMHNVTISTPSIENIYTKIALSKSIVTCTGTTAQPTFSGAWTE